MNPDARIQLIHGSLRVFVSGLLSLIPVIGFFSALVAVIRAPGLLLRSRREWNPALGYLRAGLALAVLTIGISLIAFLVCLMGLIT